MADNENSFNAINLEKVREAIQAVQARGWDVNPFTVADELKAPRVDIYRCAEAMKLIVGARGGSFGIDLQTALDFTWQLRELEEQNKKLKKQLASTLAQLNVDKTGTADKEKVGIFNLAVNFVQPSVSLQSLAHLTWKDLETIYHFRVHSLGHFERATEKLQESHAQISEEVEQKVIEQITGGIVVPEIAIKEKTIEELAVQSLPEVNLIPNVHTADWMLLDISQVNVNQANSNIVDEGKGSVQSTNSAVDTGDMPAINLSKPKKRSEKSVVDTDELRILIQSHIENAAKQIAESTVENVISSGNASVEFEASLNNPARNKFVGVSKTDGVGVPDESSSRPVKPRIVPPEIRKACLILGFRPENISYELVQEAWKKAITNTHPDVGGDAEIAVYLNTAKDTLVNWLDKDGPKLGSQFGSMKKKSTNKDKKNKE